MTAQQHPGCTSRYLVLPCCAHRPLNAVTERLLRGAQEVNEVLDTSRYACEDAHYKLQLY